MVTVLDLRRTDDPRDSVHRIVESLAKGHIVGIPTETVYGLAADALNPEAVERLATIKGRPEAAPFVLSLRGPDAIWDYVSEYSPLLRRFVRRCLPGPLTIVAPCNSPDSLARRLHPSVARRVFGDGNCIGFRIVDHPVITQLHQYLRGPLVLTSANLTGKNPPTLGQDVVEQFGDLLPLVLDDGPTRYGGASTVARVIGRRYEILRHGAIEDAAMNDFAKPLVVLVCTGNTCRSPMAEGLLRKRLDESGGPWRDINIISAGVAAAEGGLASPQAVDVMEAKGIDLSCHASRPLTDGLIHRADLVLTMTRGHRDAIIAAWPDMADRVYTLRRDGGDISDPIGGPLEMYEQCAAQIESELEGWLEFFAERLLPQQANPSEGIDMEVISPQDQQLRSDNPRSPDRGHRPADGENGQETA